jgi:hypothetical protein
MYEKIVHFHIAKTGGTTLNRWLDTLVPASRARPAQHGAAFFNAWTRQASQSGVRDESLSDRRLDFLFHPDRYDTTVAYPPIDELNRQIGHITHEMVHIAHNMAHMAHNMAHMAHNMAHNMAHEMAHFMMQFEMGREALSRWDVIHDHSPAIVTTAPNHYRFVVLRDPVTRFLSFLRDWRRCSEADIEGGPPEWREIRAGARVLPADEWIKLFEQSPLLLVLSSQTYALKSAAVYALPAEGLRRAGKTDLEVARYALQNMFNYVGITEQLDVVANRVARDVGAAAVGAVGRHNRGSADTAKDTLSERSLDILRSQWADDFAIYELAKERFRELSGMPYDETAFEQQHLQGRLEQLSPRVTGGTQEFSLNEQIIGSGFLGREPREGGDVALRTGPGVRSVLYIPVAPSEDAELILDIDGPLSSETERALRIHVDGTPASFRRIAVSASLDRLIIPVTTAQPYCKLEILFDRAASLTPAVTEMGQHGICLRSYGCSLRSSVAVAAPAAVEGRNVVQPQSGIAEVLDDRSHPDHEWVLAFSRRILNGLGVETNEDRLVCLLAAGIPDAELNGPPTPDTMEEAFQRIVGRPVEKHWLDYWVGRPDATLKQVYRDLILGEEFATRRSRIAERF